ncbi:hypothetical protein TrLO_g11829 [Triparma laevis f. longispina]|nr:hypothetical protein TrLO_g11829 [Triparma laevis f. longispina]
MALCLPPPIPFLAKTYIQENYDTQGIASKLTFFPPALPPYDGTYCFEKLPNHSNLYTLKIHSLLPPSPSTIFPSPSHLQTLGHIHNSHSLSLTFPTSGPLQNITLLSHGNASDVGTMVYRCERLCEASGGVVVGWDYRGYGESKGETTTEWECYDSIAMIYTFLLSPEFSTLLSPFVKLSDDPRIYLYGQSVGSGPSTWLASRGGTSNVDLCNDGCIGVCRIGCCCNFFCCRAREPLKGEGWKRIVNRSPDGLILHSPFLSGLRVLSPNRFLSCLDIFNNLKRIERVECKVLILHGENDEDVGVEHGRLLSQKCKVSGNHWFIPNRGHNDCMDGNEEEFSRRMTEFYNDSEEGVKESQVMIRDKSRDKTEEISSEDDELGLEEEDEEGNNI